ncbi:MAG TPA: DUF5913 domain-containing protein, partial [Vicingus sp.]|nr:DUF5913 domain-containing protein [Vicingus sp.]
LNFVKTHKAKTRIKAFLNDEKKETADLGKEILEKEFKRLKIAYQNISLKELQSYYKVSSPTDLYYRVAKGEIDLNHLKAFEVKNGVLQPKRSIKTRVTSYLGQRLVRKEKKEGTPNEMLVIGDNMQKLDYQLATCCNPIPGDEVFGFVTVNEGIKIHKTKCPNAVQFLSNYAYRVIKARWLDEQKLAFLAGIKILGIDDVGIVNTITQVISNELHVNMRSISFDSNDGIFEGMITVFVHDTEHLKNLIKKLEKINGVTRVERVDK